MGRRIVVMKLICSLGHCECDGHTVHKLSQRRLTADWLAPRESDCLQMSSKVFSEWLPSYIKVTRPFLEIFKMAGYFPDRPRTVNFIITFIWLPSFVWWWFLYLSRNMFLIKFIYFVYQKKKTSFDEPLWALHSAYRHHNNMSLLKTLVISPHSWYIIARENTSCQKHATVSVGQRTCACRLSPRLRHPPPQPPAHSPPAPAYSFATLQTVAAKWRNIAVNYGSCRTFTVAINVFVCLGCWVGFETRRYLSSPQPALCVKTIPTVGQTTVRL